MKRIQSILFAVAFLVPFNAAAQTIPAGAKDSVRDRAVKRCKENRGTDCDTDRGLREWLREDRPITEEERVSAAAGRRQREKCAKDGKAAGC